MAEDQQNSEKFRIFRASDAKGLMEEGCMSVEPYTPVQREGMNKLLESGYLEGDEIKVLVNIPGFSLTHVWFKKDYPLPLHSHSADCLYYVIAGSARLGTEELGPGDSFFVPANTPYTYHAGPEGVEVLEFRHTLEIDFQNYAKGQAFYDKAVQTVIENRDYWKAVPKPSEATAP